MNILPHKSWHVGRKHNRDRVSRDEQEAEKKTRESELKEQQAIKEVKQNIIDKQTDANKEPSINFELFPENSTDAIDDKKGNDDRSKERQDDNESWQRRVGLIRRLGYSNAENQLIQKPWYCTKSNNTGIGNVKESTIVASVTREDPMHNHLCRMAKKREERAKQKVEASKLKTKEKKLRNKDREITNNVKKCDYYDVFKTK